jgi:hypothetical protein
MLSIRRMSSASAAISASSGDSAIVAVSTKVSTLTPTISGRRKASALAPLMPMPDPGNTCMAAMPV